MIFPALIVISISVMSISYSNNGLTNIGNAPSLVKLFGEKAGAGSDSIFFSSQGQDTGAENIGTMEMDPHAISEKQKLISILKKDGPEAAMNKVLEKLDGGEISMEVANVIADKMYEAGYYAEAKAFSQTLDIKAIDPVVAQAELNKERELIEQPQQPRPELEQPQQQMVAPRPGGGMKTF